MNPTAQAKNTNRILWAIDPFQNPKYSKRIITELKSWAKYLDCDVQPITIISTSLLNYPLDIAVSSVNDFQKSAYKLTEKYLHKTMAKGFLPPQIIFSSRSSSRQMATELAYYAKSTDALMIFANTHAKTTWNPLRLGGFAETLAATSRVPLLLINDKVTTKTRLSNVLFPTNFSSSSKKALAILAPLLKPRQATIQLFNQVEREDVSLYSPLYFGYAPTLDLLSLTEATENLRKKNGEKWKGIVKSLGLKSESVIQRQKKSLGYDIVNMAKLKKSNLIAMSAERGPVAQAILGSTVRDVLLHASCPVLIIYKPYITKKMKNAAARQKDLEFQSTLNPQTVFRTQYS